MTPSTKVENLFRTAPTEEPTDQYQPIKMLIHCLHAQRYIRPALDTLIEEGLLTVENDEGEEELHVFASYHELARKADELVCKLSDRAELMVKVPHSSSDLVTWVWGCYHLGTLIGSSVTGTLASPCCCWCFAAASLCLAAASARYVL